MPRALLVDDQADIRLLLRRLLEREGFEVAEAGSGPAALAALANGRLPDVVLLDVQMPRMDGWDTLKAIRQSPETAELPVLICTVKGRLEDVAQGWELGCDGYLTKPFDAAQLVAEVRAVTSRRGGERQRVRVDQAHEALRESETRFRMAFDNAPIGMALCSIDPESFGRFLEVNAALCRITGYSEAELLKRDFQSLTHPDDLDSNLSAAHRFVAGEIPSYEVEKRYLHADGHVVWVLAKASLVRDAAGRPLYVISQIQDVTERKTHEHELEHLAEHDPLTGLFNRRRFAQELARQRAYARRYRSRGAVLLLDLDNFKYVNDTLGHRSGDELIVRVAVLLRARLRETDVLARLGGDEFAVLLPEADEDQAAAVATGLLEALRGADMPVGGHRIRVTTSVGVATFDGEDIEAEELLVRADLAMYEAKDRGRDRLVVFEPGMDRQIRMEEGLSWEARIREALERDLFIPYCQPIVELRSREISQYELLVRMPGAGREPIEPAAFLPTAERFGLIEALDGWMVRQAVRLIAEHGTRDAPLRLEVNISGRSIGDPGLSEVIQRELETPGVDPACLILEITETMAIANMEAAAAFAERMKALGCQFALDDFGAGFGSFYYLKHLPIDYLKIDGGFVRGLATSRRDQLVVKAIVQVAQGIGIKTIAEYVEDQATLTLLRSYGVDYVQGYYVGRPQPVAQLRARLAPGRVPGPLGSLAV